MGGIFTIKHGMIYDMVLTTLVSNAWSFQVAMFPHGYGPHPRGHPS